MLRTLGCVYAVLSLTGALLLALGVGSVLASIAMPINEFDPMLHFAYKGKILAELGSPLDEAMVGLVDADGQPRAFGRIITHPNYPLGVPILEALVSVLGRGWHDRWIQLPLAFWALCLPAAVFFGLRPCGKRAARAGALVAAVTPILYERNFLENGWRDFSEAGLGNEVTLGAGADLPLAAMLTASCALFLHGRRAEQARLQWLAGLCLAGAVMMKNEGLALFAYIGGLSAATGMLIVATIALSTMVCNDLVIPGLLRMNWFQSRFAGDMTDFLLVVRRSAILFVLLLAYTYMRLIGESYALVTIGLVSFAAAAQFGPALLGGMFWKGATRAGAISGLLMGTGVWLYTLVLPSFARSGWLSMEFVELGPFGIAFLKPYALFGMKGVDHLSHSLFWSMVVNIGGFIWVSLLSRPSEFWLRTAASA